MSFSARDAVSLAFAREPVALITLPVPRTTAESGTEATEEVFCFSAPVRVPVV